MRFTSIKTSLFISFLILSGALYAQDPIESETVTVVKPYSPSVRDATKIKEVPSVNDSVRTVKKPVQYSIFSVPVASTFTPTKGRATTVEKVRPPKVYNNYATLGFGNYSNILAEFYSNLEINRSSNFGVFLTHNSSQGGIKGVELDDKFYDTELNLNYNTRNRDLSWKGELGVEHQLFNWYGLPQELQISNEEFRAIDPQHNYYSVYAGGEIELYDSFFDTAEARFRHTGDGYGTSENHLTAASFFEFNIAEELISTKLGADIVNGSLDQQYPDQPGYDYTFMNFSFNPSLLILRDDLSINLGVAFYYGLDAEQSDNQFYIYPAVSASYRLAGDYVTAYAGVKGELEQNSYYQFTQVNPYVSPTLLIQPTDTQYDGYLGLKGKLSNAVSYNLKGSYASQSNRPLFRKNTVAATSNENYAYGNSFSVVYDDVNTLSFFGELNVDVNRNFRLGIEGEVFSYTTDAQAEAWNLPDIEASLNADYQISEKWFTGTNLFYVGERKDRAFTLNTPTEGTPVATLEGFFDLNAHLGYRFNEQLSAFVKGSNLLDNDYQRWLDYQVQGIQVLAGATYKFDF